MEKILVIDDEKPTLKMFRLTLQAYGYEVLTAENGREGLDIFQREHPRIVLTDIKMPGMNGIEVLQHLKQIDPQTEVIVITGHGDMDLAIQALSLDATDFINKPIQRQLLEQALNRAEERLRLATQPVREFELTPRNEAAVITIRGGITARHEARFQELFHQAVSLGKRKIVLDFQESASVNGAGIAILTQLLREAAKQGVEVAAAGLSENMKKVFEIVGLGTRIRISETLEQALA
jgi:anti-anti-sigma factor